MALTQVDVDRYHEQGFLVVRGLWDGEFVQSVLEHYMALRAEGPKPGDLGGHPKRPDDPLNGFPRMINMQRYDEATAGYAADDALVAGAAALLGDEAVLNQTMLYFKPPGSRGQGLHQDQQYITIDPLLGAWVALDACDAANGQMVVVPGSHRWDILPVERADERESFVAGQTSLPPEAVEFGVDMEPGDCLYFHGKTVHGSHPNVTADRFRRSFICHFVGEHSRTFEAATGTHMSHLAKA